MNWDDALSWLVIILISILILKKYFGGTHYPGKELLPGKTIVITGGNAGIGLQTALDLAKRGAKIILACRSEERGKAAETLIRSESGNRNVYFKQVDLASFASIRRFAKEIKSEEAELYALINNAGVLWTPHRFTEDGFELNFGVNYLGHFLLTLLLLPLLKKAEHSRVIHIGSLVYQFGRVCFEDLNYRSRSYNWLFAYCDSKLMNQLFSNELAIRLEGSSVHSYCVDPGVAYTEIGKQSFFMGSTLYRIFCRPITWLIFKSSWEAAQTAIFCACNPSITHETGLAYAECESFKPKLYDRDYEIGRQLWDVSVKLTNFDDTTDSCL